MSDEKPTKATEEELGSAHRLLYEVLVEEINAYRESNQRVPPALLAQLGKMLQVNSIDRPASTAKRKDTLKEKMPDFDSVEKGNVIQLKR